MIDEKKLLEEIKELKHGTEIALDMACGALDIECFKNWIYTYEKIIKLIEAQPKISLENKTSDWIPIGQYPDEPSLLCFDNGEMVVGYFDYDDDMWKIQTDSEYYTNLTPDEEKPIAWQPLPEKYER